MPLAGTWNDLDLASGRFDAVFHQGEGPVTIQVSVDDDAGVDKDLTGATVSWRWGNKASQVFGAAIAGTVVTPGEGLIQVALTIAQTAAIPLGVHNHQFVVTHSAEVQVVRDGLIKVEDILPAA